ncbi:MAG TPA: N-acetylmuramoyl-L-alanine amidase [Patescibacteria group bacterium]|nr:N-acetylmuramoyl-L-alanine amidase [Patescibacteria group bacterium]
MKGIYHYKSAILGVLALAVITFFLFQRPGKKVQFESSQTETQMENNEVSQNLSNEKEKNDEPKDNSSEKPEDDSSNEKKTVSDEKVNDEIKISDRLVNWGFQKASGRKIDTIIIHSTYNITSSDPFDLEAIINKEYKPIGVSPHYIIDRKGKIFRLVEDKNIAFHAGESQTPDARTGVNNFSIGIEIVNSKEAKPTDEQYNALKNLLSYLKGKYPIKYILGHRDIAKGRKDDPWNFDWGKLK